MTVKRFVPFLDDHVYREIWNAIYAEYRSNVLLETIPQVYAISTVCVGRDAVTLPTLREPYFVATAIIDTFLGGLILPRDVWTEADDVLVDTRTLVYVYGTNGRLAPRGAILFYHPKGSKRVFLAIRRDIFVSTLGGGTETVYITIYRDSDMENAVTATYWVYDGTVGDLSEINSTVDLCEKTAPHGTTILVNGYERKSLPLLTQGDVVEVICDENVIGTYEVDVSNNDTGYTSELYASSREILHCPKSVNPNNDLITRNTCTLSVFDRGGRGVHLHRTEDDAIGQITHNDLSVKTDVLDAFRDHLDDQSVTVKVRVRTHGKTNPLIHERSHLVLLYTQDDETIVRHMRGLEDTKLDFWKAENLEASLYVRLMFRSTRTGTEEERFQEYVEGLGYDAVATILGHTVFQTTVERNQTDGTWNKSIEITKPGLFQDQDVTPLVWAGGVLLPWEDSNRIYSVVNTDDRLTIVFDEDVVFIPGYTFYLDNSQIGTQISVLLLEGAGDQEGTAFLFQPATAFRSIDVPFNRAVVFRQRITQNPTAQVPAGSTVYEKLDFVTGDLESAPLVSGGTRITVGSLYLGDDLFVVNPDIPVLFSYTRPTYETDQSTWNLIGSPRIQTRLDPARDTGSQEPPSIPVLAHENAEVYMNGRKTIQGIDLIDVTLKDGDGHISDRHISPIAASYVSTFLDDVRIDAVFSAGTLLTDEAHYTFENRVSYDGNTTFWIPRIGRVFVRGTLVYKPEAMDTWIDVERNAGDTASFFTGTGWPYHVTMAVPGSLSHALSDFSPDEDRARLAAIQSYLTTVQDEVDKSTIVLDTDHTVWSPTVEAILSYVLTENYFSRGLLADDPDDTRLKELLLNAGPNVALSMEGDFTLEADAGRFDRTYLDVLASPWVRSASLEEIKFADRILALLLPNDPNARGSAY